MSKIVDALEKAKHDGNLEQTAGTVNERDTLTPISGTKPTKRAPKRKRREGAHLLSTKTLDPAVLQGVDLHIETLHKPMSVVSEQYRSLRNRIERMNFEGNIQTIAITSAVKGEGKSVTATNLAVVLAQDATKNVLLVDADLRRPKVHQLLNLELTPGLGGYLHGAITAEELVHPTQYFGLHVVTAGDVQGHPAELLASSELADLVDTWRSAYDYVIFDTPPLHPISDVNFLAESVDGVVVVVRANKTGKAIVKQAAGTIPAQKLIGTILNRSESLSRGYGYGKGYYYYKYY